MKRFAFYRCGRFPRHAVGFGIGLSFGDRIHDANPHGCVYIKGAKLIFGFGFGCVYVVLWGKEVE